MVVKKSFPPNIKKIVAVFEHLPETVCFTYGDTVYSPSTEELAGDLLAHESVHERQQGSNPDLWWNKYLEDKEFRLSQEVEAYHYQYQWVNERRPSKISRKYLELFAHHLSTIYKLDLTYHQAFTLIRKGMV